MEEEHYPYKADLERLLDEYHITYIFIPDIRLNDIDDVASTRNQVRITAVPIQEDAVQRYTEMSRSGRTPPPLIIKGRKDYAPPYVIWDGNQRRAAGKRARRATVPAFIVHWDTPDELLARVCRMINSSHGWLPSEEERMEVALNTYESGGISIQQACAPSFLKVSEFQKQLAMRRGQKRADDLGVGQQFKRLRGEGTRQRLSSLISDTTFARAVRLVNEAGMDQRAVVDLIKRLNREKNSEERQLAVLTEEEESYRPQLQMTAMGRNPRTGQSHTRRLLMFSGNVKSFDIAAWASELVDLDEEMRLSLKERLVEMDARIRQMSDALEHA